MKKLVLLLALLIAASFAGQYDLLVAYCEGSSGYTIPAFDNDTFYDSVTYMEITYTLVPASTLADYGCVYTWNNYQYQSGQGDALGDYVTDYDGAVVLNIWAITQCYGKIVNDASLCPISGSSNQHRYADLGTVHEPSHPMMDGVSTITNLYYGVSASMESGALLIADDSLGRPLAAINADENVAALQVCPGSYKYWSGDGWVLANNTIHYLMEGGVEDFDPPYVDGLDPDDGEVQVPVDSTIVFHCKDDISKVETDTIDFSAQDTSLGGSRFVSAGAALSVAYDSTRSISGDLDIDDTDEQDIICTFTPDDDFYEGDTITCTVAAGLADSRGNEMEDDFVWTFDTWSGVEETTWGTIKATSF